VFWQQANGTGQATFKLAGATSFTGTFFFSANPAAVGTWNGHR
jgi:hypothetical protein